MGRALRTDAPCHRHQEFRELLDTPTGPERGLSSPQQRRTAGGLQALTGTVRSPRVAADWKVRAPVALPRCARYEQSGDNLLSRRFIRGYLYRTAMKVWTLSLFAPLFCTAAFAEAA